MTSPSRVASASISDALPAPAHVLRLRREDGPARPPLDAIVLFDGTHLSHWRHGRNGGCGRWLAEPGLLEVAPGMGHLETVHRFRDFELNLEWCAAHEWGRSAEPVWSLILPSGYEISVSDPDAPLSDCAGMGGWHRTALLFRSPTFSGSGVTSPARLTLVHDGAVRASDAELHAPNLRHFTEGASRRARQPLILQAHSRAARFRSIWIRRLEC